MNKSEKKKLFKADEKKINNILNEWDPIPYSPADEYDCLTHKIISELHRGIGEIELYNLVRDEIVNHFGLEDDKEKMLEVSQKIFKYWINKKENIK
jgi:hypothetical protein